MTWILRACAVARRLPGMMRTALAYLQSERFARQYVAFVEVVVALAEAGALAA